MNFLLPLREKVRMRGVVEGGHTGQPLQDGQIYVFAPYTLTSFLSRREERRRKNFTPGESVASLSTWIHSCRLRSYRITTN
jgi:hypothetical protein